MKAFKSAIDFISTVLLAVFIIFVILLVGVRLVGIEPYIVLSGSMEPEIQTGSLIYVDLISHEEACKLEVGDTVTFRLESGGTKVTHKIYEVVGHVYRKDANGEYMLDNNDERILECDSKGNPIVMYTTYGINNKNDASPSGYTLDGVEGVGNLASTNVIGRPALVIPGLGHVANLVQTPTGKYITLAICLLLVINAIFGGAFDKKPKKKDVQAEAEEEPKAEEKEISRSEENDSQNNLE